MEQRPLRLGDIVDDYCPRERRITNHAIVALIGDAIRQTRCTTCEAEHAYKEARIPKRRTKKNEADSLYEQVLAEVDPGGRVPPPAPSTEPEVGEPVVAASAAADAEAPTPAESDPADGSADAEPVVDGGPEEPWFGHRRLIRASLPKTEAEPQPRPIPEFTMHQRQTRGSEYFRHGQGGGGQGRNGFRPGRSGNGQGQGSGGHGQGGRPHRGGRGGRHRGNNNNKRSR